MPFDMEMADVLTQRPPQRPLAEQDHPGKALFLIRADPALGAGIQVRALRVPVVQEIATVSEGAAVLPGRVPRHMLHPCLIGMNSDSGDCHPAAPEMDEEQHVIGHQPASTARW